eukprot:TRINITY_DN7933_c3_g3_i1.p1 TRINITY_DN7933_c3_g3~~TRINITY_DN7933_c3_g3_i1.p1  ORF type:complete len:285 (+),score=27.78 TRINITY_DN7933_c3_g3_i1:32-856(+)
MSIFDACASNNVDKMRKLLRNDDALSDIVDHNGNTLLHVAALHGCWEACEELLERCDGYSSNKSGLLPQHLAFDNNHTELAIMLRDYRHSTCGYNLRIQTPGRPDFHIVLRQEELSNIDFILSNIVGTKRGETHHATYKGGELPSRLPMSGSHTPLVIEFKPENAYFSVRKIDGSAVLVKLNYEQPLSRILNTPELEDCLLTCEDNDLLLCWDDCILDIRNSPAVYNIPCTIDPPQVLLLRHPRDGDPLSPSCRSLSRSFLSGSLRPISSSSSM